MSTRLGNFYGLFPGGFYRQTTPINYAAGDSFRKEVMETIDELVKIRRGTTSQRLVAQEGIAFPSVQTEQRFRLACSLRSPPPIF